MTKKGASGDDRPDSAASQEAKLLWAFDGLIEADGPIMVTAWVAMIEYIDKDGEPQLAPLCSDVPQWRMTGMIDAGRDLLVEEFDLAEYDDWDD